MSWPVSLRATAQSEWPWSRSRVVRRSMPACIRSNVGGAFDGRYLRTSGSLRISSIAAASPVSKERMTSRSVSIRIGRRNYALAMADVVPFHGLRFDESRAGPLSELISPPYDVISDAQRDALYARSPFNVVRLEEGKEDPADGASNNKYTRAKAALEEWLRKRGPTSNALPAFYLHDPHFLVGRERAPPPRVLRAFRPHHDGGGPGAAD